MRAPALLLSPELTIAARNASTVMQVRELITNELKHNSVNELGIFDGHGLANAERFAGGSQTNVYRKQMPDGKIIAIKEFRIGFEKKAMATPERRTKIVKYFVRECGIWKGVSVHVNIVELLGLAVGFGEGSLPALVSELYPLGSFRDIVDDDTPNLPVKLRTKLLHDACKGLAHLHQQRVVHRDIKGNNIFIKELNDTFTAALGDFGSAKFEEDDKFSIERSTGVAAVEWAPPEYVVNGKLDYSKPTTEGDIWSFGCTILEILTGRNPWCGNSIDALLHLEGLLRPLHPEKPEDVDEAHWHIMTWCWERNASDRLDAEAIALALDDVVNLAV